MRKHIRATRIEHYGAHPTAPLRTAALLVVESAYGSHTRSSISRLTAAANHPTRDNEALAASCNRAAHAVTVVPRAGSAIAGAPVDVPCVPLAAFGPASLVALWRGCIRGRAEEHAKRTDDQ
eukprot:2633-Prymnesium_polylepis.1